MKTSRLLVPIFLTVNLCIEALSTGTYAYRVLPFFVDELTLCDDSTFLFRLHREFLQDTIHGKWAVRDDSILVLTSYRKPEFEVYPSVKKGKKTTFNVTKLNGEPLYGYKVEAFNNNDMLKTKYIFDKKTKYTMKGPVTSFYIINWWNDATSPVYVIDSTSNYNYFEIKWNGKWTFDNEEWKIREDTIIGGCSRYTPLIKQTDD